MKKHRPYIFCVIALILMLWASSCKSIEQYIEFTSSTGCCSYRIYEDNCLQYEEDGYHTTYCWDNKDMLEQTIEDIHENCYDNHYQNP